MYNFVFWFFYKYFEWKDNDSFSFIPAGIVALAIEMHVFLLYSFIRYFTGFGFGISKTSYGKLFFIPFILVLWLFVYFIYYRDNANRILDNKKDQKFSTPRNILYIVLILVVPLLLVIFFTNKTLSN